MVEQVTDFASEAMARAPEPTPPRRSKLKGYDGMPAQRLNPQGESQIKNYPLDQVAKAMTQGNRAAQMLNPIGESALRGGVTINRLSQIIIDATELTNLETSDDEKAAEETPINDEALARLAKAMKEANIEVPSPNRLLGGLWQADDRGPIARLSQQ